MLTKFFVSNFRGFSSPFEFDLTNVNNYEFNKDSINHGTVNNALIYGHNGVGKSNLGLALFDILGHLSDRNIAEEKYYKAYLNADIECETARFAYTFKFEESVVEYAYEKTDYSKVVSERLTINGNLLAFIDRRESLQAEINLKGAETLNRELKNSKLSLLKYIRHNSQLDEAVEENQSLFSFFHFVDRMLFFRSLDGNMYLGLENEARIIAEDIIERGNVKNLEKFLNDAGIECTLRTVKEIDKESLVFDFNGKTIPFYDIASTGTKALTLFYFWLQRIQEGESNKVSFLFIDEFDAFYHHELSALIVENLKRIGIQFVLTTHNTSLLTNDLLRPDCYFLMNKDKIQSLAKSTPKELREAHNIEKMYKAGSFSVE